MKNLNIVWTAVSAVVFALASFIASAQGSLTWTISLSLASVTSATLASRER